MRKLKPRSIEDESKSKIWRTVLIKEASKKQKRNVRERSGNRGFFQVFKTLYRLQGSLKAHLDNCTARKIQKRPVWVKDFTEQLVSGSTKKSSYKEHRVDALAPYAEEGRGKLRKATGSGKQALIR